MTEYQKIVESWRERNVQTEADLVQAINTLRIPFAYNSSKIENANITYRETQEIFDRGRISSYTGDVRTLFEIQNAKAADTFFLHAFGEKRPLDADLICEFHLLLCSGTYDERRWQKGERPGAYKKGDYIIGDEEIGALAEDIPEEMADLLEELRDPAAEKPINVLASAAYFHAQFENIHPFSDGNGRTGRLTMNYFLVFHNHPPIIIFEDNAREYFMTLYAWDLKGELRPLQNFLQRETVRTWEPAGKHRKM